MPVTPFHFGAGAVLHALAPRHVSFIAFCLANVFIDVETVTNILRGRFPLHTFFHTFAGATVMIGFVVLLFLVARAGAGRIGIPNWLGWRELSVSAVAVGSTLGAYTHIVFDGIMHADVRPFAPWSAANPLHHAVPLGALHWGLALAGLAGTAVVMIRNHEQDR